MEEKSMEEIKREQWEQYCRGMKIPIVAPIRQAENIVMPGLIEEVCRNCRNAPGEYLEIRNGTMMNICGRCAGMVF